jgi:translation initiation factor 1
LDRLEDLEKELGITDSLAVEGSRLHVRMDSRRYGKNVTVIEGFDPDLDLDVLAKDLKRTLGTGGTVKDRTIELQGDHRKTVHAALVAKGFTMR